MLNGKLRELIEDLFTGVGALAIMSVLVILAALAMWATFTYPRIVLPILGVIFAIAIGRSINDTV